MRTNASLTELSLRHAGITDVGARALPEAHTREHIAARRHVDEPTRGAAIPFTCFK